MWQTVIVCQIAKALSHLALSYDILDYQGSILYLGVIRSIRSYASAKLKEYKTIEFIVER